MALKAEIQSVDQWSFTQDYRSLNDICELPNVTRPMMLLDRLLCILTESELGAGHLRLNGI